MAEHVSCKIKTQYVQISNIITYFHLISNFKSIHSHGKRLYGHFEDTVFSNEEH